MEKKAWFTSVGLLVLSISACVVVTKTGGTLDPYGSQSALAGITGTMPAAVSTHTYRHMLATSVHPMTDKRDKIPA